MNVESKTTYFFCSWFDRNNVNFDIILQFRLMGPNMSTLKFISLILPAVFFMFAQNIVGADEPVERSETATTKPNSNWMPSREAKTIDFNFPAGEVSLKSNGEWNISGWIRHAGVVCGWYSVGVQFGIGAPECINVDWQNSPQFSVPKRQCNNAIVKHQVIEKSAELKNIFEKITCARRIVRCKGNCKGSSGTFTSEP